MRGMWNRSYGRATKAPPDERGGNRHAQPTATAPHPDSTPSGLPPQEDQNGHGYVLADISGRYPPTEWARLAIAAYRTHRADRIVAEVNNGGDMVGATLRMVDPNVAFTAVRASRG